MAINPKLIKAGDELWDCHRYKCGNTTMSRLGSWPVKIIEIDHEKHTVVASWNGNAPGRYSYSKLRVLRRSPAKNSD